MSDDVSRPRFRIAGTVLSTRDPDRLASFYERLLGWPRLMDDDGWVALRHEDGGIALSFHVDEHYVAPTWPSRPDAQQMMAHVDIVTDFRPGGCGRSVHIAGIRLAPRNGVWEVAG